METFAVVLHLGLITVVMANGMAFLWAAMTNQNGPATAGRLNRWIVRTLWRVMCRSVGGILSWLGRIISGWGR